MSGSRWCARCLAAHARGEQCPKRKAFEKRNDLAELRRGSTSKWRRDREFVFKRDKFLCQICLGNGVYTSVDLSGENHGVCDHKVPLAEGGSDDRSNLQTICQGCNKVKTAAESLRGRGYQKV